MEAEASPFESSELVASFLASTPLLSESWRLCSVANASAPLGFVSERIGDVGYFAFSACSTQMITEGSEYYSTCRNLVPLDSAGAGAGDRPFSVLTKSSNSSINGEEDEGAVMVHAWLLNLFLFFCSSQAFKEQMSALINGSKSIVITGHSIGGTTASLCALWLLCYLQSASSTLSVLCITFGSPLLGNESLSRAIHRERWGGNFCHVVSKYDIMPRLLFAPLESCTRQLHFLLQYWQMSMLASSPGNFGQSPVLQLGEEEKAQLFSFISQYNLLVSSVAQAEAREEKANSLYWPFGNYVFCSQEGAICVENAASVIEMMHLMFMTGNPSCCIDDHLKYGHYVGKISSQFLNKKSFLQGVVIPESSYEAGVELALQSSGISKQEPAARPAEDCLKKARGMRHMRTPSLNAANLAIRLSKVVPYRAQIEWYMASCDKADEQLGYYDSFKQRGSSSKRDHKVNMNRLLLAGFWNDVLRMLQNNELPHDFHKRSKWVNTSHFYKLLVEPLDIAEYYRSGMHRIKGHYLKHGRERRFEIFDRWWGQREVGPEENTTSTRSKFAGLTQDSCFWAKVEEATEWLANVRSESDASKLALLWENINKFERYATILVDRKEVSKDVVAKNSSFSKWVEELRELKSQMQQIHPQFPRFNGELFP